MVARGSIDCSESNLPLAVREVTIKMSLTNITVSNPTNFASLAALICHLIIGGQFQVVHLFYDSSTLDRYLITEIGCLHQVSWIGVDVNSNVSKWYYQDRKERTIQLIFPNLNTSNPSHISKIENFTVYHRLFIFILDDSTNRSLERILEYGKNEIISTQGSLLILYDREKQKSEVRLFTQPISESSLHIQDIDSVDESQFVFNKLFNIFDKMWLLGVQFTIGADGKRAPNRVIFIVNVLVNTFFTQMNMDFISRVTYNKKKISERFSRQLVRHIPQPIYDEFSFDSEPLQNSTA